MAISMEQVLQQISQRLARLERQVNGQLLGNNPSTNFRQPVYIGGTQAGWFQLTNNGVNTIINNATNNQTGAPLQTSLTSIDVASGDSAIVGPFLFQLIDGTTNVSIAGINNAAEVGQFFLQAPTGTAQLFADSTPKMTLTGNGTHHGITLLDSTQVKFTAQTVAGSCILNRTSLTIDDGIGDVTTIRATGSTIVAPVFSDGATFTGGLTVSTGDFAVTLGNISGAHLQNLGAADSPTFNDIAITGYASLATELASLQTQINALSTGKANHGTYPGTVTGATCSTTI